MKINIPSKIEKDIKRISEKLGIDQRDFLINAILYYFQIMEKEIELKNEFEAWEKVSDKDFIKFEKTLGCSYFPNTSYR
jgi:hypothetical protein